MISNKEILDAFNFEIKHAFINESSISLTVESQNEYVIDFYWYEYIFEGTSEDTLEVTVGYNGRVIYRTDVDKNIATEFKYWIKKRATDWVQRKLTDAFLPSNMFDELIHD